LPGQGCGLHGIVLGRPLVTTSDNVMYKRVAATDAGEILDGLEFQPVERLLCPTDVPFFKRQQKIVLENSGVIDPERIEDYIAAGGYQALMKVLTELSPQRVIEEVTKSGLRGAAGPVIPPDSSGARYRKL